MKRGGSSGGGHSSLGYLFGSDSKEKGITDTPARPPTTYMPPYGTDVDEKLPETPPLSGGRTEAAKEGLNSGNSLTGRPSTKVKSPPGGDSSIGYLFGDKS